MSEQADKEWGEMWSREKEMECGVALQTLASCVYTHWRNRINQECKAMSGEWIEGIGLGNIHDIWNLMYHDMKALYTLEQLVNDHYKTLGVESQESKGVWQENPDPSNVGSAYDKCPICVNRNKNCQFGSFDCHFEEQIDE